MKSNKLIPLFVLVIGIFHLLPPTTQAQSVQTIPGSKSSETQQERRRTQFQFIFETLGTPFEIKVYEPQPQKELSFGLGIISKSMRDVPIMRQAQDKTLQVYHGERKNFILLIENKFDKPIIFYPSLHSWSAPKETIGVRYKGLHNSKMHRIEPGEIWYMAGQFYVDKRSPAKNLTITHKIIGLLESDVRNMFDQ